MKTWHKHLDTRSSLFLKIILKLKTLDAVAMEAFSHIPWKTSRGGGGGGEGRGLDRKALYRDLFAGIAPQTTASCVRPLGGRFNVFFKSTFVDLWGFS